jgi:hypothetical protein
VQPEIDVFPRLDRPDYAGLYGRGTRAARDSPSRAAADGSAASRKDDDGCQPESSDQCLHDFLVRCDERSLLNGFNYDRDALAAADARGAKTISFALIAQRMQ